MERSDSRDITDPPSNPGLGSVGGPVLGMGLLIRGMSGTGLGRLHRVGSNPLNEMSRHSLPQVSQISICDMPAYNQL